MTIILYNYVGDRNKVDKRGLLEATSLKATLEGNLNASTSIYHPVITIELPSTWDNTTSSFDVSKINYAYIPSFGRYYFIDDVTFISGKAFELSMNVDTLTSFVNDILDQTGMVERTTSTNMYSSKVYDDMRQMNYLDKVEYLKYTNVLGFQVSDLEPDNIRELICSQNPNDNHWYIDSALYQMEQEKFKRHIVIVYATSSASVSPLAINKAYVDTDDSKFVQTDVQQKVSTSFFGHCTGLTAIVCDIVVACCILQEVATLGSEALQSIVSVTAYPFDFDKLSNTADSMIQLGDGDEVVIAYSKSGSTEKGTTISNWQEYCGKDRVSFVSEFTITSKAIEYNDWGTEYWINKQSTFRLWIPYHKWIDLDYADLRGQYFSIVYTPNFLYNTCCVNVIGSGNGDSDRRLLYTSTCSIGTPLAYTTNNANSVKDANAQAIGSLTSSMVSATIMGVLGGITLASGNPMGLAMLGGATVTGTSSIINGIAKMSTVHYYSEAVASTPLTGNCTCIYPVIYKSSPDPVQTWQESAKTQGVPVKMIYKISDLATGSTYWISNVKFIASQGETESEVNDILTKLNNGVLL